MNTIEIDKQEQAFEQFVAEAVAILAPTNWEIGRIASESKEVTGKTDAELGERIGLGKSQVTQRRMVWDRFGDQGDTYHPLKWSHFYAAVNWEDAEQTLRTAADDNMSVAAMVRYHDILHGKVTAPEIPPITDEQIETKKPLAQPSNKKITPETTKKVDTGTPEDTAERAEQPTAASVSPVTTPQTTTPAAAESNTFEDAETRVLFALREIGQVIQEVKDRKALAAKIRKLADEIDPPRKTKSPVSLEDWTEYGQEFAAAKGLKSTDDGLAESYDHYTANGWKQNNGRPIKDWQSTCRNAVRRHAKWSEGKVESRETGMDWSAYDD